VADHLDRLGHPRQLDGLELATAAWSPVSVPGTSSRSPESTTSRSAGAGRVRETTVVTTVRPSARTVGTPMAAPSCTMVGRSEVTGSRDGERQETSQVPAPAGCTRQRPSVPASSAAVLARARISGDGAAGAGLLVSATAPVRTTASAARVVRAARRVRTDMTAPPQW
jgi:hypothetical protein